VLRKTPVDVSTPGALPSTRPTVTATRASLPQRPHGLDCAVETEVGGEVVEGADGKTPTAARERAPGRRRVDGAVPTCHPEHPDRLAASANAAVRSAPDSTSTTCARGNWRRRKAPSSPWYRLPERPLTTTVSPRRRAARCPRRRRPCPRRYQAAAGHHLRRHDRGRRAEQHTGHHVTRVVRADVHPGEGDRAGQRGHRHGGPGSVERDRRRERGGGRGMPGGKENVVRSRRRPADDRYAVCGRAVPPEHHLRRAVGGCTGDAERDEAAQRGTTSPAAGGAERSRHPPPTADRGRLRGTAAAAPGRGAGGHRPPGRTPPGQPRTRAGPGSGRNMKSRAARESPRRRKACGATPTKIPPHCDAIGRRRRVSAGIPADLRGPGASRCGDPGQREAMVRAADGLDSRPGHPS
jgi:hypothetical protein